MKLVAVFLLTATFGATGGSATVSVQPSSIGFKQALASCPSGSLAAISLTLGHVRVAESAGVDSDIDAANPSAQSVMLSNGNASATVMVNASKNTVSARHVTLASSKRVACIAPD
ncbi:MAG: hypothetical protein JOZ77_02355 [Candidatus Eremiobacteraeota bacterium]|nr:hypothetical protein [Candidatus Eremiobacteraeota bacterium]